MRVLVCDVIHQHLVDIVTVLVCDVTHQHSVDMVTVEVSIK